MPRSLVATILTDTADTDAATVRTTLDELVMSGGCYETAPDRIKAPT